MIESLIILQETKGQFAGMSELSLALKSDLALRSRIETLSRIYLHRTVSGCNNCYCDAYLELIHLNIDKAMAQENSKFKLKAGALLRDVVNFDISKNATQHNLTDELALYHLKTHPEYADLFEKLPKSWQKMAEKFVIGENDEEIKKLEEAFANSVLKSIELDNGELVPVFDPAVFAYSVTYKSNIEKAPVITVVAENEKATVTVPEVKEIPSSIEVVCVAEDGETESKYSIEFILEEDKPE